MATKPKYELIGKKKWNILYPLYINSKKSLTEGRRIPKADGVENPSAVNLYEAIKSLGFECDFEVFNHLSTCFCFTVVFKFNEPFSLIFKLQPNKTHPKDFAVNGRVRVKIYNDDDTPTNPEYPTSTLFLFLFILLPQFVI